MKLIRYISEFGEVPKGWGVCWKRMNASTASAIAPIPLNILIRWGRALWLWAAVGRWGGIEDRYLAEAVQRGQERGYQNAMREMFSFMNNAQAERNFDQMKRDYEEFKRTKEAKVQ